MDYKKADMIELYDAGVIIHARVYSDACVGWSDMDNPSYYMDGGQIETVMKLFRLPCKRIFSRVQVYHRLADYKNVGIDGMSTIEEILVNVEQPNLINVRLMLGPLETSHDDNNDDYEKQDFTYSGAYNIWWR